MVNMPSPTTAAPPTWPSIPGEELSVALALVNTRLDGPSGPRDLLATTAEARAWLVGCGLADGDAVVNAEHVSSLVRLREAVRTLIRARLTRGVGEPTDDASTSDTDAIKTAAIKTVNAALAGAPCVTSLVWDGSGPHVTQQRRSSDPFAKILAALAADAAELLSGPHAERLAQCEAHNCIRMFIRTHAARHVCSTRCGDRVRAARHYARKRQSTDARSSAQLDAR